MEAKRWDADLGLGLVLNFVPFLERGDEDWGRTLGTKFRDVFLERGLVCALRPTTSSPNFVTIHRRHFQKHGDELRGRGFGTKSWDGASSLNFVPELRPRN